MVANLVAKNRLTCTRHYRTLYATVKTALGMDATAKKLIEALATARRQIAALEQQAKSISAALEAAGLRASELDITLGDPRDKTYAETLPFKTMSLVNTCKQILYDNQTLPLDKSQIEYLASIGGYPFSTDDSKNSVDVTMRRLAGQGLCEIFPADDLRQPKGRKGNCYMLSQDKTLEWLQDRRDAAVERGEIAASTKGKRK